MNKAEQYKEVESQIPDGTTKGELMKLVYSEKELSNIDASLPCSFKGKKVKLYDRFYMVMNYNENIFGELQDMRDLWSVRANQRGLQK